MKYVKTYESFNGKTNELFNFKEKKEKRKLDKDLATLKEKAYKEISKYTFTNLQLQHDDGDIAKHVKTKLNMAKMDLPTVAKLLPLLFDKNDKLHTIEIEDKKFPNADNRIPLKWQFILKNDNIDKETAVAKLKEKIEKVKKLS